VSSNSALPAWCSNYNNSCVHLNWCLMVVRTSAGTAHRTEATDNPSGLKATSHSSSSAAEKFWLLETTSTNHVRLYRNLKKPQLNQDFLIHHQFTRTARLYWDLSNISLLSKCNYTQWASPWSYMGVSNYHKFRIRFGRDHSQHELNCSRIRGIVAPAQAIPG
jgi:hypothetical protein